MPIEIQIVFRYPERCNEPGCQLDCFEIGETMSRNKLEDLVKQTGLKRKLDGKGSAFYECKHRMIESDDEGCCGFMIVTEKEE